MAVKIFGIFKLIKKNQINHHEYDLGLIELQI